MQVGRDTCLTSSKSSPDTTLSTPTVDDGSHSDSAYAQHTVASRAAEVLPLHAECQRELSDDRMRVCCSDNSPWSQRLPMEDERANVRAYEDADDDVHVEVHGESPRG
jgi:hypothetical protein